jgi:16S rRNA (guanine(966)-N(2))-methyltransferase RsmD
VAKGPTGSESKDKKASRELREALGRPLKGSVTKRRVENVTAHASNHVRIIGGQWKRTRLLVADARGLRPTPDRVRETLFNWIEHLVPALEDIRGLDFFAGTGALGFELASRGARHVTLIENNRQLVDQLSSTKRKLAADQVDIIAGDALTAAGRWPAASFDIIFIDPPFDSELMAPALAAAMRLIAPDGLIYAESGTALDASLLERHRLQVARNTRAGRVHSYLLHPYSA